MLKHVTLLGHNTIRFSNEEIIYIDPFKLKEDYKDADIILITHGHDDHFSIEDINKVKQAHTKIYVTEDVYEKTIALGFDKENVFIVHPNTNYQLSDTVAVSTIPAYNIGKTFHPKENGWVGYLLKIHDITYYIAGDTDITEESKKVVCDVAFIPVGGTYTTTSKEAATLINIIKPKIAIPVHYGVIVGTKQDAIDFKKQVDNNIMVVTAEDEK